MWWQFPTENHIVPSPKLMALKFPNFRTSTFITQKKKVKIVQVKRIQTVFMCSLNDNDTRHKLSCGKCVNDFAVFFHRSVNNLIICT